MLYRVTIACVPLLLSPTRVGACVDDSACGGGECDAGTCTLPVITYSYDRSIDFFLVNSPSAHWRDAQQRCGYAAANGRLARVMYQRELDRIVALNSDSSLLLDGTDEAEEDTWRWSDGTVFYTRADGCLQAFCGWQANANKNGGSGRHLSVYGPAGDEHHLCYLSNTAWDENKGDFAATYLCEVPCTSDADCEAPAADEVVACSATGRCEYITLDIGE
ncbi:hypothetical protein DIPPA_56668, partial [Diplonema papillatum]